jgi:hypothetical protein
MNNVKTATAVATEETVHPLKKSHMFISSKHVDYDNLTAIEATAMTLALVLSVAIGVIASATATLA